MKRKGVQQKEVKFSKDEFIDFLRFRDEYLTLFKEFVIRKITAKEARKQGITVNDSELQKLFDNWRKDKNLHKMKDTEVWLSRNGISLDKLEEYLETNLYISKYKDKLEKDNAYLIMKDPDLLNFAREKAFNKWIEKILNESKYKICYQKGD